MYLPINAHPRQGGEEAEPVRPAVVLATEFNNFIDAVFLLMISIVAHDVDNCYKVLLMLFFYLLDSKINKYCEKKNN